MSTAAAPPPADGSKQIPDPDELKKLYAKWFNLIQFIAGTVVTVVGAIVTLFVGSLTERYQLLVKVLGGVLTLLLVGIGIYLWRRHERKRRRESSPRPLTTSNAFRGPYSFSHTLPFVPAGRVCFGAGAGGSLVLADADRRWPSPT
jgi:hypothetical protein